MSTKIKNTIRGMVLGVFTAFAVMAMSSVRAEAASYTLTLDHCTGGCGVTGTVTISDVIGSPNTVHFLVQSDDFRFVNSTSHGNDFLFNIGAVAGGNVNNPMITFSNFAAGWRANQSNSSTTQNAGSVGGGGWTFEYSVTCHYTGGACAGNGGSTPANPPLTFDVYAPGLSVDSFKFAGTGTTAIFAADVIGPTGNTGLVGFTPDSTVTTTTVPTPEPTSALLLVCGAIAIGAGRQFASKRK